MLLVAEERCQDRSRDEDFRNSSVDEAARMMIWFFAVVLNRASTLT